MDCIFCKIIDKQLPAAVLYEDGDFIVILDKFPQTKGHTLIIPKIHSRDLFELGDRHSEKLIKLASQVASNLKKVLSYEGINLIQSNGEVAGQTIFHFHLHLVPRYKDDGMKISHSAKEATSEELFNICNKYQSL